MSTHELPLEQPGRAPLDLRHFWIEHLEYREGEEGPAELEEPALWISRPVVHETKTEDEIYRVTLRIRISQGDVRAIDLTIVGVFEIRADDDGNEGTPAKLVLYNGSAMLLGAARGIIESVTSLSGLGRLRVPSANILKLLRQDSPGTPAAPTSSVEQSR